MSQLSLANIVGTNRRCLLLGLGKAGIASAEALCAIGVSVVCVERRSREQFLKESKQVSALVELERLGVEIAFGIEGEGVAAWLTGSDYAVVSPGISLEGAICGALKRRGVKIISQLELALSFWPGKIVLVTGANGKSTVAAMIQHCLSQVGRDVHWVSNALQPFISELATLSVKSQTAESQVLVVEASGYELEACSMLQPDLAIFLNLSDRDVERFGSDSRTFFAEKQAFVRQTETQFAVVNGDDQWGGQLLGSLAAQCYPFGVSGSFGGAARAVTISYDRQAGLDQLSLLWDGRLTTIVPPAKIIGLHNRYNLAAAALSLCCLGLDPEDLPGLFVSFLPLPYRLEITGSSAGIIWINDAKSTSAGATQAAVKTVLELYPDKKLILLLGGEVRGGSWQSLFRFLAVRATGLVDIACYGKDGGLLANHCQAAGLPCTFLPELQGALEYVQAKVLPDQVVLFSPGCASFDQFASYEERGSFFRSFLGEIAV